MTSTNANAIRQNRALRTRTIRRRVIAGGLALFVATWMFIAVVLVTGRDPALAARTATTAQVASANSSGTTGVQTTSSGSGSSNATSGSSNTASGSSNSSTGSSSSNSSPTSVTTQAS